MIETKNPERTLKNRNGLKKLIFLLTLLLIIFLAIIIVLACTVAKEKSESSSVELCTSKNCIESGNESNFKINIHSINFIGLNQSNFLFN